MKRELKDGAFLLIGSLFTALSYNLFLIPSEIAPGGVSGVAILIHYIFGLPVGSLIIAINIPLFVFGLKQLGWSFGIKSAIGTVMLSTFIDLLQFKAITHDILLSSVYGGILLGAGLGLVFIGGGSTGGTDIAAKMIHKRFPNLAIGAAVFVLDFIIITTFGIKFGIEKALYSLVTVFISARVIDFVIEGTVSAKAYYIISDEYIIIAEKIKSTLGRGVTSLSGKGMYSHNDKNVLLCLVSRFESPRLKKIVHECDKKAFVFVSDAREVMGEGFTPEPKNYSENFKDWTKKKLHKKSRIKNKHI